MANPQSSTPPEDPLGLESAFWAEIHNSGTAFGAQTTTAPPPRADSLPNGLVNRTSPNLQTVIRYDPILDSDSEEDQPLPRVIPEQRQSRVLQIPPTPPGFDHQDLERSLASGSSEMPSSGPQDASDPQGQDAHEPAGRRLSRSGKVDLRSLEYVSDFDDQLMCAICRCPYIQPIRLQCDHIFCQRCFDRAQAFTANNTAPTSTSAKCPSCRSPVNKVYLSIPRIVTNMIDDLKVRCPLEKEGCVDIVTRGFAQTHVDKYCKYTPIDCPDQACSKKTPRKDLDPDKCLHTIVPCSNKCETMVVLQDMEKHLQSCPKLPTTCPFCKASILHSAMEGHLEDCPEAMFPCFAAKYGCHRYSARADLDSHVKECALVTMMPYMDTQAERLDNLEATNKHLKLRNDILEGCLSNIQNTLGNTAPSTPAGSSDNVSGTPSGRSGSQRLSRILRSQDSTSSSPSPSSSTQAPPNTTIATLADDSDLSAPFDSPTHHLLCLHESLRDEVSRISAALNDLDARSSMTLMNETLRLKDELAHTNAAVGSMRVQLHWLISSRLQQQRMMGLGAGVGAAGNMGVGAAGPSAGPGVGPSTGLGAGRRSRSSDGAGGAGLGGERTKL